MVRPLFFERDEVTERRERNVKHPLRQRSTRVHFVPGTVNNEDPEIRRALGETSYRIPRLLFPGMTPRCRSWKYRNFLIGYFRAKRTYPARQRLTDVACVTLRLTRILTKNFVNLW